MLKVLTHSVGVAGIVGALIFSPMAIQAAQADAAGALRLVPEIGGAVRNLAPAALRLVVAGETAGSAAAAGTCVASVVCGGVMLGIGVGLLAYTTRDTWVPWVKSWANNDSPSVPLGDGPGGYIQGPGFRFLASPGYEDATNGYKFQIDYDGMTWPSNQTETGAGWRGTFQCSTGGNLGDVRPDNGSMGNLYGPGGSGSKAGNAQNVCWPGQIAGYSLTINGGQGGLATSGTFGPLRWGVNVPVGLRPSDATTTTEKVCRRPDGTTYTDARSISGNVGSIPVGYCLPGDVAVSLQTKVGDQVTQHTDYLPTPEDLALYPNCAGAACKYQIVLDGIPCVVGMLGCSEWAAISQATPGRVQGRYGTYAVPLDQLGWMTNLYRNADGLEVTPTTRTGGLPAGAPAPEVGTVPVAHPPAGAPGGDPLPRPGTDPLGGPSAPPSTNADCFKGPISWNPVDWVVTPVQCALAWAFVPSDAFVADWGGRFNVDWTASAPGAWIASVGGMGFTIPSGGCEGPALPTGFLGQSLFRGSDNLHTAPPALPTELHPFAACTGVMRTVADTSNLILTVGISFFGGMRVVQQLGYAFGFKVHAGSERSTFT